MAKHSLFESLKTESTARELTLLEAETSAKGQVKIDVEQSGSVKSFQSPQMVESIPRAIEAPEISFESFPSGLGPEDIKKINRAFTKGISPKIEENLIKERNELVKKKVKEHLTKKEQIRLTFLKWQLDRIDDAKHGEHLDFLGRIVGAQEEFAKEIGMFLSQIGVGQSKERKQQKSQK